jgi:hypothetical protein
MRVLKAGAVYFLLVFAAGFALGVVRELWVKEKIGARAAETAEVPLMIGVSALAALLVVRRHELPRRLVVRLTVGLVALALLVGAELTIVVVVRGQSIERYLASRDPAAFTVYLLGLVLYALMPALVSGALAARR